MSDKINYVVTYRQTWFNLVVPNYCGNVLVIDSQIKSSIEFFKLSGE